MAQTLYQGVIVAAATEAVRSAFGFTWGWFYVIAWPVGWLAIKALPILIWPAGFLVWWTGVASWWVVLLVLTWPWIMALGLLAITSVRSGRNR